MFKDTYFIGPLKLETNDSLKVPIAQTLNNPINIFFKKNPNIILYRVFCDMEQLTNCNNKQTVTEILFNLRVGRSVGTNISFFLLSACTDQL